MGKRKEPRRPKSRLPLAAAFAALGAVALGVVLVRSPSPAVPDPDTSAMEPRVAARIGAARADVERDPRSAERWGTLGTVFQAHDLFREAEASYAVARKLGEGEFRWPYLQARSLKELQEIDRALDAVRAAIKSERGYMPLYVLEGELLEQAGRFDDAATSYENALDVDPGSALASLGLGRLDLERGNVAAGLVHLERAAELQPDAGAIQATLARAYLRNGQRELARQASELAKALHPSVSLNDPVMAAVVEEGVSVVGYQKRATEAESRGEPGRAEALLRQMIEIRPEQAILHYNLANNLSRQGRAEEAEGSYRKALSLDPEQVPALVNLGILRSGRGDLAEAKALFQEALEIEPEHPGALASLAKVAALEGDVASAVRFFERALAKDERQAETHYALAQVLRHQGRLERALESFSRALELAPDRADIHFETSLTHAQAGDYPSAWRHLKRAREIGLSPPPEFVKALSTRMPEPGR